LDVSKAVESWKIAANHGDSVSMLDIGYVYDEGLGVRQDFSVARYWYEKSAAKNNDRAKKRLRALPAKEAEKDGRYADAARFQEQLIAGIEAAETRESGRPGSETAYGLTTLSWYLLLSNDYAKALLMAERAIKITPNNFVCQLNLAHALMFSNRSDEARPIYLGNKGKMAPDAKSTWEQMLKKDFLDIRSANLNHPLMDEIEKELGVVK
jgi:tetratricopeptide (TPR) repeat protein